MPIARKGHEDKPAFVFHGEQAGRTGGPCRTLADAGVNILSLSLGDTQKFGAMRLIVDYCQKARESLAATGCVVKEAEVVVVELEDRPGGLADALEAVEAERINVEYIYALTTRQDHKAALVFRFGDVDAAIKALRGNGIHLLGPKEITRRVD